MSKVLLWLAVVVGVVWLVSQSDNNTSAPAYAPTLSPNYPTGSALPAPGRYGGSASGDPDEADDSAEEVRQAKQEFEEAADELRTAVNDLRQNRWDGQMSTIRSRLEDADDALSKLEALRPNDPAVQNARDEVDSMHSHISRLHYENWRGVRPDLDSSASAIEDEATSVSEDSEDE